MIFAQELKLRLAAVTLKKGGVVAHACEGVWGLACDPFDEQAVARLLEIKRRNVSKGLIVIAADAASFGPELDALPAATACAVKASWPGPNTWIVPHQRFPSWVSGGRPSVAVRVPGHAQARRLAARFGGPLISTSANRAGQPAPRSMLRARKAVGDEVDYLLPGMTCGLGRPSRIRDATSGRSVR